MKIEIWKMCFKKTLVDDWQTMKVNHVFEKKKIGLGWKVIFHTNVDQIKNEGLHYTCTQART
jgi:hypothetical protein